MMAAFGPEQFQLKNGRTVLIRHCDPDDAIWFSAFQKLIAAETSFTMQVLDKTPAIEKVRENWKQCLDDPLQLRLGVFDGDQIIGQLGFRPLTPMHPWTAHLGQFGMMVLKSYWGQGIGKRILEIMDDHAKSKGFSRIEAMVRVKNERGVKLYRSAGYLIEGTRRHAAKINGEYWDEYFISKLLLPGIPDNIQTPWLETKRLILRLPAEDDAPRIIHYLKENESHFAPTDPPKPDGFYSEGFWRERANKALEEFKLEQSVRFFLFDRNQEKEVIGSVSFTQLSRGPFQACYLGYAISKRYEGQGLMTEALQKGINFVFDQMNFHRIMANYLPDNIRSARLLKRLAFDVEGQAKNYLFIDGAWRDYVLTSLTNSNWRSP